MIVYSHDHDGQKLHHRSRSCAGNYATDAPLQISILDCSMKLARQIATTNGDVCSSCWKVQTQEGNRERLAAERSAAGASTALEEAA